MPASAGFRTIEHTADIGIAAWGDDLEAAFAAAGRGLFSLMADLRTVRERLEREIKVTSPDRAGLLVEWLNELIYIFDTEQLLLSRFEVKLAEDGLSARGYGEPVDPGRHHLKTAVKAATYHQLRVVCAGRCRLRVIFDI